MLSFYSDRGKNIEKAKVKKGLRDLHSTLEWLRSQGLLLETDVEVTGDSEITGVQKHLDRSIPILFHKIKGYPHL